MQVANAEVLLDDVSEFGDELVATDLEVGQFGGGGVLAHDVVLDLVKGKKVPMGLPGVAFVCIDLFDLVFGMTTVNRAVG